jgi:hypothetical protein
MMFFSTHYPLPGHVASRSTCEYWSSLLMPQTPSISPYETSDYSSNLKPFCPFCVTQLLSIGQEGGPYNRLILQTDDDTCNTNDNTLMDDDVCQSIYLSIYLSFTIFHFHYYYSLNNFHLFLITGR